MLRTLAITALLVTGCALDGGGEIDPPRQLEPAPALPNLVIFASNQSFDIDPVDIHIALGKAPLVTGDFLVEGQHSWHRFDFAAPEGPRQLTASSSHADSESITLDVGESTRYVVVDFWYYPPGSVDPTGPLLSINEYDEQPVFQ